MPYFSKNGFFLKKGGNWIKLESLLFKQQTVSTRDNRTTEEIFSTKETSATIVHVWKMARSSAPKNIVLQVL